MSSPNQPADRQNTRLLDSDQIEEAAGILAAGGLVAFPTETVYGLGADAANDVAVSRVFEAKARPSGHPLIVHLASVEDLPGWTTSSDERIFALAAAFWPGPLTLIVPRTERVSLFATGGRATVGLRVPDHPGARELIRQLGRGVVGPSANRFGHVSPTTAAHVMADLSGRIDAVLDGGAATIGIESTILEVLPGKAVMLLRPGGISVNQIEAVLGEAVVRDKTGESRAAGMLVSHYSPVSPVRLVEPGAELELSPGAVVIVAGQGDPGGRQGPQDARILHLPAQADGFARGLYAALRAADATEPREIVVIPPTSGPMLIAILDRLAKAAGPSQEPIQ